MRKVLVGAFAVLVLALLAFGIPRTLGIYVSFLSDADLPVLSELEIPGVGKVFEPVYDDPRCEKHGTPDDTCGCPACNPDVPLSHPHVAHRRALGGAYRRR